MAQTKKARACISTYTYYPWHPRGPRNPPKAMQIITLAVLSVSLGVNLLKTLHSCMD